MSSTVSQVRSHRLCAVRSFRGALAPALGALLAVSLVHAAVAQSTTFSYTGADQTYLVPNNVVALNVELWGAGGGIAGGSGAFVSGWLPVTPGESLTIVVGQGGSGGYGYAAPTFGGGASAYGESDVLSGQGGGLTGIFDGSTALVIASGGGGGSQVTIGQYDTYYGGGDGIDIGETSRNGSTGGTQSSAGSTPNYGTNGGYLTGGPFQGRGAGGGSGYYGGAGGFQSGEYGLFGGGGGSSLTAALINAVTEAGQVGSLARSSVLPGGSTNPDYLSGIGIGGAGGIGGNGGSGLLIIKSTAAAPEPDSFALAFPVAFLLLRFVSRKRYAFY